MLTNVTWSLLDRLEKRSDGGGEHARDGVDGEADHIVIAARDAVAKGPGPRLDAVSVRIGKRNRAKRGSGLGMHFRKSRTRRPCRCMRGMAGWSAEVRAKKSASRVT